MNYEKPNLEEMDLVLEGSFLDNASTISVPFGGEATGNPWL